MRRQRFLQVILAAVMAAGILGGCGGRSYLEQKPDGEMKETAAQGTALPETGRQGTDQPESAQNAELQEKELQDTELPESVIVLGGEQETGEELPEIVITQEAGAAEHSSGADGEPGTAADSLRLLFAGDVLLSDHVLGAYQNGGGIAGVLDDGYRREIADADFFMVNQEFPFSDRGTQAPDKQYTFRLPPEKVSIFTEMNIDAVTLANNHALDFGTEALLDSVQALDDAGILHTGAGADLDAAKQAVRFQWNEKNIAVIGATRVIPVADWAAGNHHPGMLATYDPAVLLKEIGNLSETNDLVIVYVHWGIEREELPQEYQRNLAEQYIDAGADLVIGSHPHVLQGIEYYKGKPIVYSLGNFVFGSQIPRTMLLEATASAYPFGEENSDAKTDENTGLRLTLRLIPGTSKNGHTRKLTDEAELKEFYRYLESISFNVTCAEDGTVLPEP